MGEGGFGGDSSGDTVDSVLGPHVVNWTMLPSTEATHADELRERAKQVPKGVIALEQLQAKRGWTDAEALVVYIVVVVHLRWIGCQGTPGRCTVLSILSVRRHWPSFSAS